MAQRQLCQLQDVRKVLGKSQSELAQLLGTSIRAVQSYEQGWRPCPSHVQKMAAMLLFMNWSQGQKADPCWKTTGCSKKCQQSCPSKSFGQGKFCWMITGTNCHGKKQTNWQAKVNTCKKCPVIAEWLPS